MITFPLAIVTLLDATTLMPGSLPMKDVTISDLGLDGTIDDPAREDNGNRLFAPISRVIQVVS